MGLVEFFKRKHKLRKSINSSITEALDGLNSTYEFLGEDCYIANIERTCGLFRPTIAYSSINNMLTVIVPFVLPVPKHATKAIASELNKLNNFSKNIEVIIEEKEGGTTYSFNGSLNWDQGLSLVKNRDEYNIFASTYCVFDDTPTSEDIRKIITQTIDLMDNEHFRSSIYTFLHK